jgi:hypothetical protein
MHSRSNSQRSVDRHKHRRCGPIVLCAVIAFMLSLTPLWAQTPPAQNYVPLSVGEKAAVFGKRIIAPTSLAKSAVTAGINQYQDSPEEWGQGLAGYGRRYGHKLVTRGFENGIGLLVAVPLHQDPRYFPSEDVGAWPRLRHALAHTVITRNDRGDPEFSVWRFAGNYGSQFVSNAWRPERETQVSDTLRRGTVSIGYDAASNLLKEFWPEIRRHVFRRR